MQPSDELESRAKLDSQFIDFEERCAECSQMFAYHELRTGCRGLAAYCPGACTVFRLPSLEDVIGREHAEGI